MQTMTTDIHADGTKAAKGDGETLTEAERPRGRGTKGGIRNVACAMEERWSNRPCASWVCRELN